MPPRLPRIAVILDENTSSGGTRYEAPKTCFSAIRDAGGLPFGIPYLAEMVDCVITEFDGVLCGGGRFAYPDAWYVDGDSSRSPPSDRLDVERRIVEACLARDKPIFGICAGMQLLACVAGSRLWSNLATFAPSPVAHDQAGAEHPIAIVPQSRLHAVVGTATMSVNSSHREAVGSLSAAVSVSARAADGIVEAIEISGQTFAIGVQWHQERYAGTAHPGNRLFAAFVAAARDSTDA